MQLVRNQSDELRIGGLAFGIGYRIAEEALQCIQIAPIPGDFNGVSYCPFDTGWGGAEGFGHLGVEDLGDGVGVLSARLEASGWEYVVGGLIAFSVAHITVGLLGLSQ